MSGRRGTPPPIVANMGCYRPPQRSAASRYSSPPMRAMIALFAHFGPVDQRPDDQQEARLYITEEVAHWLIVSKHTHKHLRAEGNRWQTFQIPG